MKARADDRTLLRDAPTLNILSLQDSAGIDPKAMAAALQPADNRFELVPSGDLMPDTLPQPTLSMRVADDRVRGAIQSIVDLFQGAKTFGSLLTVPESVMQSLPMLEALLAQPKRHDLFYGQALEEARERLAPLVKQAKILGNKYNCVVANPPYMSNNYMPVALRNLSAAMTGSKRTDLFACFTLKSFILC